MKQGAVAARDHKASGWLMTVNWERGLMRLWVVASVGWVSFITFSALNYAKRTGHLPSSTEIIAVLSVPLAVLVSSKVLTKTIRWIIQGFRPC